MREKDDNLMSPRNYAKRVGMAYSYIYKSIYNNKLDGAYKLIDGKYFVYPDKVDKILNKKPI
jgi:hypothetical protein